MHVVYKITFVPHLGSELPKFYIGSKHNYTGNYYGSVASCQVFDFTEGMSLFEWWKKNVIKTPSNILFEVLEEYEQISPYDLVLKEREIQILHDVKNNQEYFNQSIATEGFCSVKRTKSSKDKTSLSTKKYWQSPEGIEKKKRLSERNKKTKSEEMKKKWEDPEYRRYMTEKTSSREITEETRKKLSDNIRLKNKIEYKGKFYYGWKELEESTGVTRRLYQRFYLNGYDPEPNVNVRNVHKQIWIELCS
jgi:hypothetical protein